MKTALNLEQICSEILQREADRPAVQFEGHWYSWGDIRRVASQLQTLIGACGSGECPTVAFVARNKPSALAAFLGLLQHRCTIRMVYPFQSAEAISNELAQIRPGIVVAAKSDFSAVVVETLREQGCAAIALSEMSAEPVPGCEHTARASSESAEPQVILLTSGTTGPPKQFPIGYQTIAEYYTGRTRLVAATQDEETKAPPTLLYFPVSNISGLYTTLPALVGGSPIVLLDRFNLDGWLDFVVRYRPQFFGLPPVGYKMVLDANVPKEKLSSIQAMGAGAAPLDPDVQRQFEERYGISILLSYGATEFGGPVTAMTLDFKKEWGERKTGSVGKPLPGMAVRVVGTESGEPLPPGSEGLLEVISCRMGAAWIRTSDLGVIDEDGFLFLKGRADGAIMRGGFKLVPASIEAALLKNPKISMASVVGIPDARLGQIPAAAIELKRDEEPTTISDIERELRKLVPATYVPAAWKLVSELPRTPSMKVDIPKVKQLFLD